MKQQIIKIEHTYNADGSAKEVKITRGSYYTTSVTRTYSANCMSDAQHNLSIALSNRDKWTTFFYKNLIAAYPAWFMLKEGEITRAAGTLDNCRRFFKPGMKIIRRMDYPKQAK